MAFGTEVRRITSPPPLFLQGYHSRQLIFAILQGYHSMAFIPRALQEHQYQSTYCWRFSERKIPGVWQESKVLARC